MIWIGIDPGAEGAVVAIDDFGRVRLAVTSDNHRDAPGYYVGRLPCPVRLHDALSPLREEGVALAALEDIMAPARVGTTHVATMGKAHGVVYATLRLLRLPVRVVPPAKWGRDIFGAKSRGDRAARKDAAIRLVSERIPELRLVPAGCRVPHDGLADAACLALWARERA